MGSTPRTLMEVGIMAFLEIIYDLKTRQVIAFQEWEEDRGVNHDWSLLDASGERNRGFIRFVRTMPAPIEGILDPARYRLTVDLTALEDMPGYVPVRQRLINKRNTLKQALDGALTQTDLINVLKQIVDDYIIPEG